VKEPTNFVLLRLKQDEDIELVVKAMTASALSDTPEEALRWFTECEQGHIPGDCVLCGAE
jgi:hypothetical protein